MPIFQPRNRHQILRQMVARAVGRSSLARLFRNSIVAHVLAAAADEDAEQYFQMVQLRKLQSIRDCRGSDLDERAAEIFPAFIGGRRLALHAGSFVVFGRPGTTGVTPIPAGSLVSAQDGEGLITFRTTASGQIDNGASQSASIPVVALIAGERANVVQGQINILTTTIPGVTSVTNLDDVSSGRDRESDENFFSRLEDHVQALSRGTITALRSYARNVTLPDGRAVLFAKVYEPNPPTGYVFVYIDDGTGTLDSSANRQGVTGDLFVDNAAAGETDVVTTNIPIDDLSPFELRLIRGGTSVLTRGVDYYLNPAHGRVTIAPSGSSFFPGGSLQAGDDLVADYTYFIGLVQEVQTVMSGVPGDLTKLGVAAGGVTAIVRPALGVPQSLEASAAIIENFDPAAVIDNVRIIIVSYINGLDIGAPVIIAEIIERAMSVPGMRNFLITSYNGSNTIADQIVSSNRCARTSLSSIVVT